MTMSEWLEELLKDNESMEQINRILKGKKLMTSRFVTNSYSITFFY